MPPQYLSTDPNAGTPIQPKYLSTDPNAGTAAPYVPQFSTDPQGYESEVIKGAGKGLLHTATALSPAIQKIPVIGKYLVPEEGLLSAKELSTPTNSPQKFGFEGEQGAEFLVPGPMEGKVEEEIATHLPQLGRAAEPLARIATSALSTGAVNKLQGGGFGTGAAMGGSLGAVGEGLRAAAPSIAESAVGITKKDRGFGRTPGRAILEDTSGVRPGSISSSAQKKIGDLTAELENIVSQSNSPVDMAPAIKVIDSEIAKAVRQNSKAYADQLQAVRDQLTTDFRSGQPIPMQVQPSQALELKRGIGNLEKSWNPDQRGMSRGTVRKVYKAIDTGIDQSAPGTKEINQRISSLIPVSERAESAERGAPMGQRLANRMARPTGALLASGIGGAMGYEHGGTPGAATGAVLGLVAPEILSSPTVMATAARAADSAVPMRLLRTAIPAAKSAMKSPDDEEPEK